MFEVFIWWLIVEVLGFLALPFSSYIFKNIADRGYGFSKIIGILAMGYITWVLSHILPYNLVTIGVSFVVLLSSFILLKKKVNLKDYFKKNLKIIRTTEIIFFILFLFFTIIRAQTPAAEGLEKLFDLSMINGILKSPKMPPIDPWYSGGKINYYYFGHFVVATLTKISFLPSYITFNLALGMLFALISVGTFSICYNLTKKVSFGLAGILFLVFIGNLLGFLQILTMIKPSLVHFFISTSKIEYAMTCCHNPNGPFWPQVFSLPVWSSTRIIPNTINEFPYASFLFGEVHSHILSIPFQLLFLGLLLELFSSKMDFKKLDWMKIRLPVFLTISLVLGCLYFTNSWELPTYTFLFGLVLVTSLLKVNKKRMKSLMNIGIAFTLTLICCFILILPYITTVKKSINYGFVNERSNLFQILIIFSVFIFIGISYFLSKKFDLNFASILFIAGSLILVFCEIGYIDSRYNTIFKFYYHVWILWAISTTYFLSELCSRKGRIWKIILVSLVIVSCTVTVFSTIDRIKIGLENEVTLDGLDYMKRYHPDDYGMVMWARENIQGNPVILEAPGGAFTYSSIVSSNTGLQTIVGWDNHEAIHRGAWPTERVDDGNEIYNTTDVGKAINLMEKYNISYVFIGSVELGKYSEEGLEKFNSFELVKQFNGNKIFK